jgi:hypothetical protein
MEKLTYKDFKIGQTVVCVKLGTDENHNRDIDLWEQHITIGKKYIEDLDFHFFDTLCVKSDNGQTSMFIPIELFVDNKYVRKLKLEKINVNYYKKLYNYDK